VTTPSANHAWGVELQEVHLDKDKEMPTAVAELMKVFAPVIKFTQRIERKSIDLSRSRTEIARVREEIAKSTENLDARALAAGLAELFGCHSEQEIAALLSVPPDRPRRRNSDMLCEYLTVVDRDAPFAIGIMFGGTRLVGLTFVQKAMAALRYLRDAARGSGETRIEALRVATPVVLESFYKELVTVLYEIECLRLRRTITPQLAFGNMLDSIVHSTSQLLPGFVDAHAAAIRNAASHDRWDERTVGSELLDLHDTRPELRGLTPPQVYRRLRERYRDVHDLANCMLWRLTVTWLEFLSQPPMTTLFAALLVNQVTPELDESAKTALASVLGPAQSRLAAIGWIPRARDQI
jgi:hypothetical protein